MPSKKFEESEPQFTEENRWQLDQIIMEYWDAKSDSDRKRLELQCYKQFKQLDFSPTVITYLEENSCEELAKEMRHFAEVHSKVPHEHEKRLAA